MNIPTQEPTTCINPLVVLTTGEPRTTTLAIAEGMAVEHKAVIQLVRTYQTDLEEFGPLAFEMAKGKALPQGGFAKATEYVLLNEQHATLIMTYMKNTEIARTFKKRLVKAFYELAHAQRDPHAILRDPTAMRGLLLGYTEKVLELQAENAVLAPKAAISDLIAASNDLFGFRQAAKILNISENKFRIYLIESGWIYYLSKRLTGTAKAIKKGYLDVRMKTLPHAVGDEPKIVTEMYFTAKGIHKLAEIFHITPTLPATKGGVQ
jgi:phage antirepressor YoqD-like protein